jgi:chromosome segregation ATPase
MLMGEGDIRKSGEEVVINLKNLSHADPRRKEITALASEYKKGQRSYKDLKRREAEMTKEVARIRDELRERTLKLQYKEEKERKSGKEYKGRKKKGLDKARQKSRDLQREYEDSTLMLRRLQAEVKDTALQLNERGNQVPHTASSSSCSDPMNC